MQELMANVLRSSEESGLPPNAILQSPAVQQQLAALLREDAPMVVPQGASVIRGGQQVFTNPKEFSPRNRQVVTSGAGVDAQGRPLVVPLMLDPETGESVPIKGIQPVSKGPLATATATATGSRLESAEQGEKGKLNVKGYEGLQLAGSSARKANAALDVMDRIISRGNFDTGFAGETRKAAQDVLSYLGSKDAKTASADAGLFRGAAMDLVLQKQLAQKGPQTESDARRLEQTVASIKSPTEANRFLISYTRAMNNRDIAQQEFFDKYWAKNNTYEGAEASWYGYGDNSIPGAGSGSKSVFDDPTIAKMLAPKPAAAPAKPTGGIKIERIQ
jgi:hypothetical protein